ncbi:MAG: SurA N-terminal domain-containing protein [Pseudomonadota bacterium]
MFEFIRNNKKWMQVLLALLIIPSFVLVGVASQYGSGGAGGDEVANVGGTKITQQEWEQAQRQQMDRYRGIMGDKFDPKQFETPEAKQAILDNLIAERALAVEIEKSKMSVGDAALAKSIAAIQAFRKPDGTFDKEQYKALLASQGMSPAMFEARMRVDLAQKQLADGIQGSSFMPRTVSSRLSDLSDQERMVQEIVFPSAQYLPQVQVSDAMVKAYYDKNATLFQVPEQLKVEYVVLDAAAVESQVAVTDAEVADYYSKNQKSFTTPEQRNASHILITTKKDMSAADKAAAKAKAAAVLAEVRAAPANFAAIAKAQSQDPSSAELGGDLGLIEKDALPKPVEDTVYKLKQGEISDLVESDFGFHIVTVTRVAAASVKPLEEAKAQITAELKKSRMSKKYSEMAAVFNDMVYDQSDSLKPAADKLGLKIQAVDNLSRSPSPALGDAPVNNAKFLKAIFADDALKNKRNTEAIEVAPSTLVSGRVVEYKPAAKRALAEVAEVIKLRVAQEEAGKLAKKAGEAKLAAAKASGDLSGFGPVKVVTRSKQPEIHPAAAMDVLKADTTKLPAYVGVDIPGTGYGVYLISKVAQPAQLDVARRAAEAEQIDAAAGSLENHTFLQAVKVKHKAKVLVKTADVAATDTK